MNSKIIPINDSMISGYDDKGVKLIRTTNGSEYIGDNTHAELTNDMKRIIRLLKQEVVKEEVAEVEEIKPKQTRRKRGN